ncbi:MAG: hypothetical protein JNL58_26120 [Planctomyces sp.]|nr:hypothetical protein [Planctomyces sp.]
MNPYQSTIPSPNTPRITTASAPYSPATNRLIVLATAAVVGFPLFSVALVVGFWLFACMYLGHFPIRYSGPNSPGAEFAEAKHVVSLIFFLLTPFVVMATFMGLLSGLFVPVGRLRTRVLVLLYYIAQNVGLFLLLSRVDRRFMIIEWLTD